MTALDIAKALKERLIAFTILYHMIVNCSHGKGIKFIREDLKFFAKTNISSNKNALCFYYHYILVMFRINNIK